MGTCVRSGQRVTEAVKESSETMTAAPPLASPALLRAPTRCPPPPGGLRVPHRPILSEVFTRFFLQFPLLSASPLLSFN